MCVYIYMYVCMCVCVHIYMYIYIYIVCVCECLCYVKIYILRHKVVCERCRESVFRHKKQVCLCINICIHTATICVCCVRECVCLCYVKICIWWHKVVCERRGESVFRHKKQVCLCINICIHTATIYVCCV